MSREKISHKTPAGRDDPAASLPLISKRSGAKLILLNRDPTPLDDIADAVIHDEIGRALPKLVA